MNDATLNLLHKTKRLNFDFLWTCINYKIKKNVIFDVNKNNCSIIK